MEPIRRAYKGMLARGADPQEWADSWRSQADHGGFKAVDFLMEEVVRKGKCVGCAACVVVCPADVFDFENEQAVDHRNASCVFCELCVEVCPVLRPPDTNLANLVRITEPSTDEGF